MNASRAFPLPLVLRALAPWELPDRNRQLWERVEPFVYVSPRYGEIVCPAGRITDLASVPRWVPKWIADADHPHLLFASQPHDEGYEMRGALREGLVLSRASVDWLMLEAMEQLGVPEFRRKAIWKAVSLGGGKAWKT